MSDFVDKEEFLALPDKYESVNDEYAEAYKNYKFMDDMQDSFLAGLILEEREKANKNSEKGLTVTELKYRAQASEEYKEFFADKNADRETAVKLEGRLKATNMKFEAMRSVLSSEKTMAKMAG